jgi:hypothetical protein
VGKCNQAAEKYARFRNECIPSEQKFNDTFLTSPACSTTINRDLGKKSKIHCHAQEIVIIFVSNGLQLLPNGLGSPNIVLA